MAGEHKGSFIPRTEAEETEQLAPYFDKTEKEVAERDRNGRIAEELEKTRRNMEERERSVGKGLDSLVLKMKTHLLRIEEEREKTFDPKKAKAAVQEVIDIVANDAKKIKEGQEVTLPEWMKAKE